jgi:hypothetical protein
MANDPSEDVLFEAPRGGGMPAEAKAPVGMAKIFRRYDPTQSFVTALDHRRLKPGERSAHIRLARWVARMCRRGSPTRCRGQCQPELEVRPVP